MRSFKIFKNTGHILILSVILTFLTIGCSPKSQSSKPIVLGTFEFLLNPGDGSILITPNGNSPMKVLKEANLISDSKLGPLYNLGWGNSLDVSTGVLRVLPSQCSLTDYNAEAGILTASVQLSNQTNVGGVACPTGAETYCDETYTSPIELRIYALTVHGICDTVADPSCASPIPGTPQLTQAHLTGINRNSGCSSIVDSDSDGYLDCMADDPHFTYTPSDYPEYQYHPTWDYSQKCDVQTQNPSQSLDPGEYSGCKFLQFEFTHPQLNSTNIPVLTFYADVLGYVQPLPGQGLMPPEVGPVISPTRDSSQNITVTLSSSGDYNGDTAKITGGASDVTCKDNDPCDSNPITGTVVTSVNLNTNTTNQLYIQQRDTEIPFTYESSATVVNIVHDTIPPTVSSTDPLANATYISPGTNVLITFDEPIDPSTINTTTITLARGVTPVAGVVTLSSDKYTATFNPNANLNTSSVHTITVLGGTLPCANCVKDLAGNPLAANYTSNFTTASNDTVRPTVNSTNPPDNASGISLNNTVQVIFSEAIDQATLTSTNFAVTTGGSPVAGTRTLSVDGTTATFTPDSLFSAYTQYNVNVKGPTGIKDLYGNFMLSDYLFSFTTGAGADTTPPSIVSTNPENLATNVSIYIHPQVVFSEPINPSTITISSLFLKKSDETILSEIVSLSEDGLTATLTPTSELEYSGTYVLTIGETIADLAGNTLSSPQTVQFITVALPDTTPPTVTTTVPNWYSGSASVYTSLVINFSEPIDPNTVSTSTIKLYRTSTPPCGGTLTPVPGIVELSDDGYTAYFWQQSPPLVAAASYCVTIDKTANGLKDLAGNVLVSEYSYVNYFKTTNTSPGNPYIVGVSPSDGSTNVPRNSNIIVTFSEPVSPTTVTSSTFYLVPAPTGGGVITVFQDKLHARFNPTNDLDPSTAYSVITTTGIKDLSGARSFTASSTSFTTGASADTDGPTIVSTDPTNGATNIERWQNITITFNEPIDPATVSPASLELIRNYDSSSVSSKISLSANGLVAMINPINLLNNYEYFTIKIKTSVRNLSGFALQSFTQAEFRTKDTSSDTTPPTVQSTIPTPCGATGVAINITAVVYMSEPIDPDSAIDGYFSIDQNNLYLVIPTTVTIMDQTTGDPNPGLANSKILIDPWSTLGKNTRYRIYVDYRGVVDYANNHLSADFICSFRTGNN